MKTFVTSSVKIIALVLGILCVTTSLGFAQNSTVPTDLGVCEGYTNSAAFAINASGQAAVTCYNNDNQHYGVAAIYFPEEAYGMDAGLNELETPTDWYNQNSGNPWVCKAYDINDNGEVIGECRDGGLHRHAFIWLPQEAYGLPAGMHPIEGIENATNTYVMNINNNGQVVGQSYGGVNGGFMWQASNGIGEVTPLATDDGSSISISYNTGAKYLNDNGQVIGYYQSKSFIWEVVEGTATATELFSGDYSKPWAINNNGEVIGTYGESEDVFLYVPNDGTYQLDVNPINQTWAGDINDAGQIVGWDSSNGVEPATFWMWENDEFTGLGDPSGDIHIMKINAYGQVAAGVNSLYIPSPYGYFWSPSDDLQLLHTLGGNEINVLGINDGGQVVGASSTENDMSTHACVWGTPSALHTAELIVDGGENPTDVGDLNVTYDDGVFTVEYLLDAPWEVVETHVYIGDEKPNKSAPGKFPYQEGEIEFDTDGVSPVYIAAYADVRMDTGDTDEDGNPIFLYEGMWAQADNNIPIGKENNWATCFEYALP